MIPSFRRTLVKDGDLRLVQDSVDKVLGVISKKEILDGQLLKDVGVSTQTVFLEHKLGREVQGYIVVKNNAAAHVYDEQDLNPTPTKTLALKSNTTAIVSLWVF